MNVEKPHLFDYGIHNEASDIRVHVGMVVKKVYVFPTIDGKRVFTKYKTEKRGSLPAFQPGVTGATAWGFAVPWEEIPNIRAIPFEPVEWLPTLSTTDKGKLAVAVVSTLLKKGNFPLWIEGLECEDRELNISGTDITVKGRWKIQVKCDARCGHRELGGTGNLYLQEYEANPLGLK